MPAKPLGYWKDFANLEQELLAFVEAHGAPGVMPTSQCMRDAGRNDLNYAIDAHGGIVEVAERLGLAHRGRRKPYYFWQDPANVDREVLAFIAEQGEPGVMPTKSAIEAAGRFDLSLAITRNGGHDAVARRLGLYPSDPKRPRNYWAEFARLEQELRAFVAEPGRPARMPTQAELGAVGRFDLHYAIQRHGGFRTVAQRLGWQVARGTMRPEPGSAVDRGSAD